MTRIVLLGAAVTILIAAHGLRPGPQEVSATGAGHIRGGVLCSLGCTEMRYWRQGTGDDKLYWRTEVPTALNIYAKPPDGGRVTPIGTTTLYRLKSITDEECPYDPSSKAGGGGDPQYSVYPYLRAECRDATWP
jgi:hypothetical protein